MTVCVIIWLSARMGSGNDAMNQGTKVTVSNIHTTYFQIFLLVNFDTTSWGDKITKLWKQCENTKAQDSICAFPAPIV